MKLFKKRRKLNNKGLSLVELVCAVAIFGLATTAIGGAMVVSAQNYSRGTYELDVQQEAQTTTNLIGNLLYGATEAKYDNNVLVIEGEGIEYHITYNPTDKKLEYAEYIGEGNPPATGTLAENVTSFSTNLDDSGNKFKADKNVEITLAIGKNNRTYEATYSTTARNGVADSSGIEDSASIIIDNELLLEPGQSRAMPFEVVGNIANKAISISAGTGISAVQNGSNITVSATDAASGEIFFTVATIEKKRDDLGNLTADPLASATVRVKIRRVDSISSPMDADNDQMADSNALISGTNYRADAVYRIDFRIVEGVDGSNLSKEYGKAYDMDYVNPRQFDITWDMTGMEAGYTKEQYVTDVQIVNTDNPYITFKLGRDMPGNSIITLTATAKHPAGVNKTSDPYKSTPVTDVVQIKYNKNIFGQCDFLRGSDGVFILTPGMLTEIENELKNTGVISDPQNSKRFLMTIYELKDDGSLVSIPELTDISLGTDENMKVDSVHSAMLDPKKKYMYQLELMYYTDTSRTTPLWTDSPYFSEFYPLDAVAISYTPQLTEGTANGTAKNKGYEMPVGSTYEVAMEVVGVNMSRYGGDIIQFTADKWYGDTLGWQGANSELEEQGVMSKENNSGKITYKFKFKSTGVYRVKASLNNFNYDLYNGSPATPATYELSGGIDNSGYFYINVK